MAEILLMAILSLPIITFFGFIFGVLAPNDYQNQASIELDQGIQEIWNLVTRLQDYPRWIAPVLEMKCENLELQIWKQESEIIPLRYQVTQHQSEWRLEFQTVSDASSDPKNEVIHGKQTIQLEQLSENRTRITMIQNAKIMDPLLRSYLFLFHRKDPPIQIYLRSLKKELDSIKNSH